MSSVRLLLLFAEAAKRGSFAAAARELAVSPSAVVKAVARLEAQLEVRLFHRTTRRVALTQDGARLYERCRRILDELAELESAAAQASRVPTGVLRIDAPITYAKQVVVPVVAKLAVRYPELRIDLRLSDRFADVIGSGVDAVVRVGAVADSRLVARAVDQQRLRVYAAPAYLERKGRPTEPAKLAKHDCVVYRLGTTGRDRPWEFRVGRQHRALRPETKYVIDEGEGLVAAAVAGLGLIQCPDYMARNAVANGSLEEVLTKFRPAALPISVVFPSHRHVPVRLRLFIDALVAHCEATRAGAARASTNRRRI